MEIGIAQYEKENAALKLTITKLEEKLASCGKTICARDETIARLQAQLESSQREAKGLIDEFAKQFAHVARRFYGRPTHFYSGEQVAYSDIAFLGDDCREAKAFFVFINELLAKIWSLVWTDGKREPRPDWILHKCFAMISATILDYVLDTDFQWFMSCNMILVLKNSCHCHGTLNLFCRFFPGTYGSDQFIHQLSVSLVEKNEKKMVESVFAPNPGDLLYIYDQASPEYKPGTSLQSDQAPEASIVTLSTLVRQYSASNSTESLQSRYDCSPKAFPPNRDCPSTVLQLTIEERLIHKRFVLEVLRNGIRQLRERKWSPGDAAKPRSTVVERPSELVKRKAAGLTVFQETASRKVPDQAKLPPRDPSGYNNANQVEFEVQPIAFKNPASTAVQEELLEDILSKCFVKGSKPPPGMSEGDWDKKCFRWYMEIEADKGASGRFWLFDPRIIMRLSLLHLKMNMFELCGQVEALLDNLHGTLSMLDAYGYQSPNAQRAMLDVANTHKAEVNDLNYYCCCYCLLL